jgi:predicted component of type VI protein secretion system
LSNSSFAETTAQNVYEMGSNVPNVGTINFALQYDGAGRLSALTSNWSDTLHPPTLFTADPTNGYTAARRDADAAAGQIEVDRVQHLAA